MREKKEAAKLFGLRKVENVGLLCVLCNNQPLVQAVLPLVRFPCRSLKFVLDVGYITAQSPDVMHHTRGTKQKKHFAHP
jgi:hypothetical protein